MLLNQKPIGLRQFKVIVGINQIAKKIFSAVVISFSNVIMHKNQLHEKSFLFNMFYHCRCTQDSIISFNFLKYFVQEKRENIIYFDFVFCLTIT